RLRETPQARRRPREVAGGDRRARLAPGRRRGVRHVVPQRVGLPARARNRRRLEVRRARAGRHSAPRDAADAGRARVPGMLSRVPARARDGGAPLFRAIVSRQDLQAPAALIASAMRSGVSGSWVSLTPVASWIALAIAAGA